MPLSRGSEAVVILPPLGMVPADFRHCLLHLLQHERLPVVSNLCGVRLENVAAHPPKGGILEPSATVAVGEDFGDGDTGPDRGAVVVNADPTEFTDNIHDPFRIRTRKARLCLGDLDLRFAIEMPKVNGDQPIHQRILSLVDSGIFFGVRGQDGSKVLVYAHTPLAGPAQVGQIENPSLQDAEQHIVGLRPGTVEFIVNQRVSIEAGGGKPVVLPESAHALFGLHYGVDVIINELALTVAGILANQVGAAKLVVAMEEDDRAAELRGNVQGEGRLPRSCQAGKMDCISYAKIAQRPIRQSLNMRGQDKFFARLRNNAVSPGFDYFAGY